MTNIKNINKKNLFGSRLFALDKNHMINTQHTNQLKNDAGVDTTVRFIDGTFNAEDASEVLLSVIKDKIRFHGALLLSNIERFGVDASNSEQRIAELKEELEVVRNTLARAKKEGKLVTIKSKIQISLKD